MNYESRHLDMAARAVELAGWNSTYARGYLNDTLHAIAKAIDCTPTGKARNALCDANIHLLSAQADLQKAIDLLTP